jgi:ubiquinone/menaquinone biosynthesis C-methylase UbiE
MGSTVIVKSKTCKKAKLIDRVELYCGDAMEMPFNDDKFDSVFSSFTLELFDIPEIPKVLNEIKRILKPKGRLGIISTSEEDGNSILIKLYEWSHKKCQNMLHCRPTYVEQSLKDAGFETKT